MKKILSLCTALLCVYQVTKAQTQQGSQNLAFSGSYQHSSNTSTSSSFTGPQTQHTKVNTFSIGPSYGFFVSNGSELGANLFYNHQTNDIDNSGTNSAFSSNTKTDMYGASIFFRKYVLYDNKVGFRVGPVASYSHGKSTQTNLPSSTYVGNSTSNSYGVGGILDLVYYPSSHLGIATSLASLSYNHSKTTGVNAGSTDLFGANFINSGLTLSVFWVLGK